METLTNILNWTLENWDKIGMALTLLAGWLIPSPREIRRKREEV